MDLWRVDAEACVDALKLGPAVGGGHQLVGGRRKRGERAARAILHPHVKAAGIAHAGDGRGVEGHGQPLRKPHAKPHELLDDGEGRFVRLLALVPGLEHQKDGCRACLGGVADDVHAREAHDVLDAGKVRQLRGKVVRDLGRARERRARREHEQPEQVALVLIGHKAARQAGEKPADARRHNGEQPERQKRAAHDLLGHGHIMACHALEPGIEPAEKGVGRVTAGPEQQGAERGGEGQGHAARDDDGNGDGDGELLVHQPGHAAGEGHGDEDRAQHKHNGDDRAGHFGHGLCRGLARGQAVGQVAFHVFQHHNGVVHHQADSENQAEHGQRVDGEAERVHPGECAHNGHGHGQTGDERGPPVLQKEVHHQKDQDHRLKERFHHFVDGDFDEHRGVVGNVVGDAGGEGGGKAAHGVFHFLGRGQGVGPGGEEDAEGHGLNPVLLAPEVVALGAEFHPRHVLQAEDGAVRLRAEDDLPELFGRDEPAGRDDVPGDGHVRRHGFVADAPGRELGVLAGDGVRHVIGRDLELLHFLRVKPEADGVILRGEVLHVPHAGQALQFIHHIEQGVVAQIGGVVAAVGRGEKDDLKHGRGFLEHGNAHALHFLRKLGRGELHPVVHVDGGLIRIGADVKGHGERHAPVAGADRIHVDHVVHAVDLAFQQGGDSRRHHVGARPVVGGGDGDLGRGHVRELLNGQDPDGDGPHQGDDKRNHCGKHGTSQEKAFPDFLILPRLPIVSARFGPAGSVLGGGGGRHGHFVPSSRASGSSAWTMLTGWPGWALLVPSTTMRSPGFRPSSTRKSPP